MPKDHLEEISNAGVTELLRSPEGIPEEALEKRLEASLEIENRQEEMVKTTDWSEEMEEEEYGGEEILSKETLTDFSEINIKRQHTETYYEYIKNMLIQNRKVEESKKIIKQQEK